MARIFAFVALAASTIATASADVPPSSTPTFAPGDFQPIAIDANVTTLLATSLANDSKYGSEIKTRLCYADILRVERQVVAGDNTRYHITGCEVSSGNVGGGKCLSSINCTPSGFAVTIWRRVFDDFQQVVQIKKETITTPTPTPTPQPRPSCGN